MYFVYRQQTYKFHDVNKSYFDIQAKERKYKENGQDTQSSIHT